MALKMPSRGTRSRGYHVFTGVLVTRVTSPPIVLGWPCSALSGGLWGLNSGIPCPALDYMEMG